MASIVLIIALIALGIGLTTLAGTIGSLLYSWAVFKKWGTGNVRWEKHREKVDDRLELIEQEVKESNATTKTQLAQFIDIAEDALKNAQISEDALEKLNSFPSVEEFGTSVAKSIGGAVGRMSREKNKNTEEVYQSLDEILDQGLLDEMHQNAELGPVGQRILALVSENPDLWPDARAWLIDRKLDQMLGVQKGQAQLQRGAQQPSSIDVPQFGR